MGRGRVHRWTIIKFLPCQGALISPLTCYFWKQCWSSSLTAFLGLESYGCTCYFMGNCYVKRNFCLFVCFPALLGYNRHVTPCQCKMYNIWFDPLMDCKVISKGLGKQHGHGWWWPFLTCAEKLWGPLFLVAICKGLNSHPQSVGVPTTRDTFSHALCLQNLFSPTK